MSEEIARDLQDRAAAQYEALTEAVRAFVEWEMERVKRQIKAVSTVFTESLSWPKSGAAQNRVHYVVRVTPRRWSCAFDPSATRLPCLLPCRFAKTLVNSAPSKKI